MSEKITAKARTGQYVGKKNDSGVMEFLGIRYAQPPQRWKAAKKLEYSDRTFSALEYAPVMSQVYDPVEYPEGQPFQCEDALTLNIYTSGLEGKKPVYVFIHGGSFLTGSNHITCFEGIYCGDKFAENHPDIVYVNFTYRMGALGAMDLRAIDKTGEYADSNNIIILDQIRALEWIYENIEAFGGDPEHITIGGQSAGSYSAIVLTMLPEARKYFKAAILESSSPTNAEMKTLELAAEASALFRKIAGAETIEDLLALTGPEIAKYGEEMFYTGPRGAYSPTRDGRIVPLMPEEALTESADSGIVWLSGTNAGEYDTMMTDMSDEQIRAMIKRRNPLCTDKDIETVIKSDSSRSERLALMDLHNDCGMRVRQIISTEAYTKGGGKVYYYYTIFQPKGNFIRCQHCTELAAVSGKPYAHATIEKREREQWFMGKEPDMGYYDLINNIWANFIKYYDPNGEGVGTEWKPYTLEGKETAIIGNDGEISMSGEPRSSDMDVARHVHKDIVLEAEARH